MLWESFRTTGAGISQIFLLGAIGYFLVKKEILGESGLDNLSRLTLDITLPVMIFCQLVSGFSFSRYPDWWLYPLLSVLITAAGLGLGIAGSIFIRGQQHKLQFISLVAFQNSGYLPLALVGALLPAAQAEPVFIYLFLFLLGFNLVMFSFGVYLLAFSRQGKFELASLFSPPVVAVAVSLLLVHFGLPRFIPDFIMKPLKMVGDCTLPLAMFVVGGNIAQIHFGRVEKKGMVLLVLTKLVLLPAAGLAALLYFRLPELLGFLLLVQLAMPSATTLSVIVRHYKKDDLLVSQGIFCTHLASIVTLPVFLSLYFMLVMLK